jgi:hypothetical protein
MSGSSVFEMADGKLVALPWMRRKSPTEIYFFGFMVIFFLLKFTRVPILERPLVGDPKSGRLTGRLPPFLYVCPLLF